MLPPRGAVTEIGIWVRYRTIFTLWTSSAGSAEQAVGVLRRDQPDRLWRLTLDLSDVAAGQRHVGWLVALVLVEAEGRRVRLQAHVFQGQLTDQLVSLGGNLEVRLNTTSAWHHQHPATTFLKLSLNKLKSQNGSVQLFGEQIPWIPKPSWKHIKSQHSWLWDWWMNE